MARVQHVAELQLVDLRDRAEVPRDGRRHLAQLLALHRVEVRELHGLAPRADEDLVARVDLALVDPQRGEAADVRIHVELEHVPDEVARAVTAVDRERAAVAARDELLRVALERIRHQLGHHAQQLPKSRARLGRHEADGHEMPAAQRSLERLVQLLDRDFLALLEVAVHQLVVELDDAIGDLVVRRSDRREIGRFARGREQAVGDGLAVAGREVHGQALLAEYPPDFLEHLLQVDAARVDLVDDDEPAELALGGRRHHALRNELRAALGVDDDGRRLDRRSTASARPMKSG